MFVHKNYLFLFFLLRFIVALVKNAIEFIEIHCVTHFCSRFSIFFSSIYSENHTFRTFKHSTRLTTTKIDKIRDKINVRRTALKTQLALCLYTVDKTQLCYLQAHE